MWHCRTRVVRYSLGVSHQRQDGPLLNQSSDYQSKVSILVRKQTRYTTHVVTVELNVVVWIEEINEQRTSSSWYRGCFYWVKMKNLEFWKDDLGQ